MSPVTKRSKRIMIYAVATGLLSASVYLGIRNQKGGVVSDGNSSTENGSGTEIGTSTDNGTRTTRHQPRDPKGVRGANAPSLSASSEVAAIIGNQAITHDAAADQLSTITLDSSRSIHERAEALEHVIILTSSDAPAVLLKVAGSPALPATLAGIIIQDSFNRPDRLQGEMLLSLLENKDATIRQEAIEKLTELTKESHGSDRLAWQRAISGLPKD